MQTGRCVASVLFSFRLWNGTVAVRRRAALLCCPATCGLPPKERTSDHFRLSSSSPFFEAKISQTTHGRRGQQTIVPGPQRRIILQFCYASLESKAGLMKKRNKKKTFMHVYNTAHNKYYLLHP